LRLDLHEAGYAVRVSDYRMARAKITLMTIECCAGTNDESSGISQRSPLYLAISTRRLVHFQSSEKPVKERCLQPRCQAHSLIRWCNLAPLILVANLFHFPYIFCLFRW
jgi:hypothetical protein